MVSFCEIALRGKYNLQNTQHAFATGLEMVHTAVVRVLGPCIRGLGQLGIAKIRKKCHVLLTRTLYLGHDSPVCAEHIQTFSLVIVS